MLCTGSPAPSPSLVSAPFSHTCNEINRVSVFEDTVLPVQASEERIAVAYLCSEYSEFCVLREHTGVAYLCSEYSELNYALILLLSHSLRG